MSNLNLNKVILGGRMVVTPELKQTTSGVSVASFDLAVNRRKAADKEQETDFIRCSAWRQTAEFIAKYFKKGSAICVTGSIQTRAWTDKQGNKRYATEVVVDEAMFVDSKNDTPPAANGSYIPGTTGYIPDAYAPTATPPDGNDSDDDLPF